MTKLKDFLSILDERVWKAMLVENLKRSFNIYQSKNINACWRDSRDYGYVVLTWHFEFYTLKFWSVKIFLLKIA